MLDIIKAHAVNNLCYIAARKMEPKGIVVHSTGANNPYLKRYVDAPDKVGQNKYGNHWNVAKPGGSKVCVHAFIGYDNSKNIRIAEILPLNICCWGVGKGKKGSYNYDPAYIQFEICEDNLGDKAYYKKSFKVAAEYCAELCKTYHICVDHIVGHCEAHKKGYGSNHSDPEHWMKKFGETMDDFRLQVSEFLKTNEVKTQKKEETLDKKTSIEKGDLVAIDSNAKYYNGKTVPSWVKTQKWYVANKPVDDRIVIDKNEKGTNSICSPIHKKYLTVVKQANASILANSDKKSKPYNCPYRVKVITESLSIRKGAGMNTAKVGAITDKGVYTIVEEMLDTTSKLWGKLKSGAGWIALDDVKILDKKV